MTVTESSVRLEEWSATTLLEYIDDNYSTHTHTDKIGSFSFLLSFSVYGERERILKLGMQISLGR